MYVDYNIEEYSEEVFKLLDEGAQNLFMCIEGHDAWNSTHTFKSCQSKGRKLENEAKLHSLRRSSGNVEVAFNFDDWLLLQQVIMAE